MEIRNEDIMTRKEVAKALSVGLSTVALYISQGKLKTHKVFGKFDKFKKKTRDGSVKAYGGIKTVLLKHEVEDFIESCKR